MGFSIFVGALFVLLFIVLKKPPRNHALVIYRLGKPSRVCREQLTAVWPFVEMAKAVPISEIYREQKFSDLATKDGPVAMKAVLRYQITDPLKSVEAVSDRESAVLKLLETTLRDRLQRLSAIEAVEGKAALGNEIARAMQASLLTWGIGKCAVELPYVDVSDDVMEKYRRRASEQDR